MVGSASERQNEISTASLLLREDHRWKDKKTTHVFQQPIKTRLFSHVEHLLIAANVNDEQITLRADRDATTTPSRSISNP